MSWIITDKAKLQQILGLDRDQLIPGSVLSSLMDFTKDFDSNYQSNLVDQVQTLIVEIETLQTENPIKLDGSESIKREKIDGEIEIEYQQGTDTAVIVQQQVNSKRTKILNILDPNRILERYTNSRSSRVVR